MVSEVSQDLLTITRLLDRSREARYNDPHKMIHLAELAQAAAERLSTEDHGAKQVADIRARVWAELANAYRVGDFLDLAEGCIKRALDHYEFGTREPLLLGLIADRLASLLCHKRRFPEAFLLLDRLYGLYRSLGHANMAGRALITRGLYTENAGDPKAAVLITREGLKLLDREADPQLVLAGLHNLMWCLTELQEFKLVATQLKLIRPLYGTDRLNLLRLAWVEARVAAGTGQQSQAEELYQATRTGFFSENLVFPGSLVSLELALLWQSQARWGDVRGLAEDLVSAFRNLGVGREAIVALLLLRRSVDQVAVRAGEVRNRILSVVAVVRSLEKREANA